MTAEDLLVDTASKPTLTANDRCDRCSAQAYVKWVLEESELLFCKHHHEDRDNAEVLEVQGFVLYIDEREKLLIERESSADV